MNITVSAIAHMLKATGSHKSVIRNLLEIVDINVLLNAPGSCGELLLN
jgi:hypothetical protein